MKSKTSYLLLLALPYGTPGAVAPFFFAAMDLRTAGRITGSLFILSGLYGIWLCNQWNLKHFFKKIFQAIVVFELGFWGWRFFAETPLKEFQLYGINGSMLHGFASMLYLVGGLILLTASVYPAQTRNQ